MKRILFQFVLTALTFMGCFPFIWLNKSYFVIEDHVNQTTYVKWIENWQYGGLILFISFGMYFILNFWGDVFDHISNNKK